MNFNIPELFHIKSATEEKVFKIMENIEISKASGIDKLPGRFLKDGAKILSTPISEICNLSISHEIFPVWKVAKLKPVFKKSKKVNPSNYRPISSSQTTIFFNWDSLHARLTSHYKEWSY